MNARRGGFTLVEMLVVMAILAVLASSVAAVLIAIRGRGAITKARAQISMIEGALAAYQDQFGSYPPDTGYGLDIESGPGTYDAGSLWRYLIRPVRDPKTGELVGPFLDEWPRGDLREYDDANAGRKLYLADPWGRPYAFAGARKRLVHNPGSFDVFSCGPDEITASDDPGAGPNLAYDGLDNDDNGVIDDAPEFGPEASRNGDIGDDINNWSGR